MNIFESALNVFEAGVEACFMRNKDFAKKSIGVERPIRKAIREIGDLSNNDRISIKHVSPIKWKVTVLETGEQYVIYKDSQGDFVAERVIIESASCGATGASSVASIAKPMGTVSRKVSTSIYDSIDEGGNYVFPKDMGKPMHSKAVSKAKIKKKDK